MTIKKYQLSWTIKNDDLHLESAGGYTLDDDGIYLSEAQSEGDVAVRFTTKSKQEIGGVEYKVEVVTTTRDDKVKSWWKFEDDYVSPSITGHDTVVIEIYLKVSRVGTADAKLREKKAPGTIIFPPPPPKDEEILNLPTTSSGDASETRPPPR